MTRDSALAGNMQNRTAKQIKTAKTLIEAHVNIIDPIFASFVRKQF